MKPLKWSTNLGQSSVIPIFLLLGVILLVVVGCNPETDLRQADQSDSGNVTSKLLELEVTSKESNEAEQVSTFPCVNYGGLAGTV